LRLEEVRAAKADESHEAVLEPDVNRIFETAGVKVLCESPHVVRNFGIETPDIREIESTVDRLVPPTQKELRNFSGLT
jgi:hypothetical protein